MKTYDFREGEVLLVDKPLHWTSFDVVNKLRWKLKNKYGIKRFKVGHAGTLDPLATGLLLICTGKKTKISQELTSDDKVYTGTILLGKTTPSFDLETEFDSEKETSHLKYNTDLLERTAQKYVGRQEQTPPIFSAKKIDGKRAYESARKGKDIKMKSNTVHIEYFKIDVDDFPEIRFKVKCSKGTYIRSLANDFGANLGVGGTLIELRRVASGNKNIEDAKSVEKWLEIIDNTDLVFNNINE